MTLLAPSKKQNLGASRAEHYEHEENKEYNVIREHDAFHVLGWSWPKWRKWQILGTLVAASLMTFGMKLRAHCSLEFSRDVPYSDLY